MKNNLENNKVVHSYKKIDWFFLEVKGFNEYCTGNNHINGFILLNLTNPSIKVVCTKLILTGFISKFIINSVFTNKAYQN